MSIKNTRRTRKHRRSTRALLSKGAPKPRHKLTAGRTGKVAGVRRRTQRNEGNGS